MTITKIICLVIVLVLTILGSVLIVLKSKKHNLAKWLMLFGFLGMALTWIFSFGRYNGATFTEVQMYQQGLSDIPNYLYYAINFAGDKLIFLLILGFFYGILNKIEGYKKLVKNIANKFKGKEIVFALFVSLLLALMTSLFSQTFIAFVFVPFIISILLAMNVDKITAFAVTFGSIMIGLLGITYGGEGAYWFNYYTSLSTSTGLLYRVLVLVVAYILFNFFTVMRINKNIKNKNKVEADNVPFIVEKVDEKAKSWPIVIIFFIIMVVLVLGFVNWNTFGITCFDDFHKWLIELKIGDFPIFAKILGNIATEANQFNIIPGAFGHWDLFIANTFLGFMTIIVALIGRVKFDEFLDGCIDGAKAMAKPIALFIGTYLVMLPVYQSTVIPTITNTIFKNISSFNPYLVSLNALLTNIFHADFGFTGFTIGTFFVSNYASNIEVIHTIFTTLYGFGSLCLPTSGILLIGLSYLDIDYKTWIKYIWMFIVAMLVILLVLFTIMTYI